MFRDRLAIAALLLSVATWLLLSLATLNADYKTEVQLAPMGSGHVPTYSEFMSGQGLGLLSYFVPYHANPLVWVISAAGFCALFTPFFAALLAVHWPVRLLCVLVSAFTTYAAAEVLLAFPAANRNGCEACTNVGAFQVFGGIVLLVVAFISRSIHQAKSDKVATNEVRATPSETSRDGV